MRNHECGSENVEWVTDFKLGGLGETVERRGFCKKCKKWVREVWVYSCELVEE